MELELRVRVDDDMALVCHAMPVTAIDAVSRSAQAQGRLGSFSSFASTHDASLKMLVLVATENKRAQGATHRGELPAFGWGVLAVCTRASGGAGLALVVHDRRVGMRCNQIVGIWEVLRLLNELSRRDAGRTRVLRVILAIVSSATRLSVFDLWRFRIAGMQWSAGLADLQVHRLALALPLHLQLHLHLHWHLHLHLAYTCSSTVRSVHRSCAGFKYEMIQ